MTINLVTGGLGFIGSHLIDNLIKSGENIICLDNLSSGSIENLKRWDNNPKFKFIQGDILDKYIFEFDKLWHFACPASPKEYLKDPILTSRINFEGTLNLLNMARIRKAKVLFASSSEVYGNCSIIPQVEKNLGFINTKSERSCYAHGKRLAETLCFDFHRKFRMDIKVARIFNIYGPRLKEDDGRVVSNFINQAMKKRPLTINGNGYQTRSFCFIDDAIKALILLMECDYLGPVNIGNPSEIRILDLAKLIDNKFFSREDFVFQEIKLDEPLRRCPSLNLINKLINWYPKISLNKGLDLTINHFMDKDDLLESNNPLNI